MAVSYFKQKRANVMHIKYKEFMKYLVANAIVVLFAIVYIRSTFFNGYKYDSTPSSLNKEVQCKNIKQSFLAQDERLRYIDFFFSNITEENDGFIGVSIEKESKVIYQGKIAISRLENREWYQMHANIPLEKGDIYDVQIATYDTKDIPNIALEQSNKIAIRYAYATKEMSQDGKEFLVYGILSLVFLNMIMIYRRTIWNHMRTPLFKFLENKKVVQVVGLVLELLLACLIIQKVPIVFSLSTKSAFILLSLFSMVYFNKKVEFIINNYSIKKIRNVFLFFNLYASFALVGNTTWVYPLNQAITVRGIFLFIVVFIWLIPIEMNLFYYIGKLKQHEKTQLSLRRKIYVSLITIVIASIPFFIFLYAFNPGFSSEDTTECLALYAHSIQNMPDWHPPFYCMLLRVLIKINDSTYMVIMAQYIMWLYVLLEIIYLLLNMGISRKVLYIFTGLVSISASYLALVCTIWKDIPYAISLLWITVIIAKLILMNKSYEKKKYIYAELVVALVFICLLRQNGIVPFIVILLSLIIHFRHNYRIWLSSVVAILCVCLIKGPVYSNIGVVEAQQKGGMYIGLSQDIMAAYYENGTVSEETIGMINTLTKQNNSEFSFNPYWGNQSYDLDVSPVYFVQCYLDTFVKNAPVMIKEILCRQDTMWNVFAGKDAINNCVNYLGTQSGIEAWDQYYPSHKDNFLSDIIKDYTEWVAAEQLTNVLAWRTGIYVLGLIFILSISKYKKKGKYIIICMPVIGQAISLLLSTGWADYRYYWPITITCGFLIILIIANDLLERGDSDEDKGIKLRITVSGGTRN